MTIHFGKKKKENSVIITVLIVVIIIIIIVAVALTSKAKYHNRKTAIKSEMPYEILSVIPSAINSKTEPVPSGKLQVGWYTTNDDNICFNWFNVKKLDAKTIITNIPSMAGHNPTLKVTIKTYVSFRQPEVYIPFNLSVLGLLVYHDDTYLNPVYYVQIPEHSIHLISNKKMYDSESKNVFNHSRKYIMWPYQSGMSHENDDPTYNIYGEYKLFPISTETQSDGTTTFCTYTADNSNKTPTTFIVNVGPIACYLNITDRLRLTLN